MTTTGKVEETASLEIVDTCNFPNIFICNAALRNFHKICRFCLSFDNIKPFSGLTYEQASVQSIIFNCFSLKVDPEDHLPYNLCVSCIAELIRSYKFKKRCVQATSVLKDASNDGNCRETTETAVQSSMSQCFITNQDEEIKDVLACCSDEVFVNTNNCNLIKNEEIGSTQTIYNGNIVEANDNDNLVIKTEQIGGIFIRDNLISDNNTSANLIIKNECLNHELTAYNDDSEDLGIKHEEIGYDLIVPIHNTLKDYNADNLSKNERKKKWVLHNCKINTPNQRGEYHHKCSLCKKSFTHKCYLDRHIPIHTGEKTHRCHICQKSFIRKSDLTNHMLIHTGERPYECTICTKSFTRRSSLNMHIRIHTGERPYICSVCKKSFIGKSDLDRHILIHMKRGSHNTCNVCKKSFSRKSVLKRHMLIHTDDKPYECDICKKSFFQKSNLNTHMLIHVGKGSHKCGVCKKSFLWKSHLNRHMLIHTGKTPHKCSVCRKSFSQKSHLKEHVLIHTGERLHKCSVCLKSFTFKSYLKKHMLMHTGEKIEQIRVG